MIRNDSDRYTVNITAANTVKASVPVQMVRIMAQLWQWMPLPPPIISSFQIHQQHFYQRQFPQQYVWRRQVVWNAIHLLLSPPAVETPPVVVNHSVVMA
ncbi:hypothetical protein H6G89_04615 [Oscillatoria sp. FACHB-1407]|uniref:hypothetical protein n=1 Tax=Oscillatoria sp. FACHB-1407 TaxID=2692847 RepID=UPI001686D482|nr:hypothetical protein [Oscillatoria sp. FACHB-1407]MBD2460320.1 hypothetical protein [Oscillatoria sp. FACHB-1407]